MIAQLEIVDTSRPPWTIDYQVKPDVASDRLVPSSEVSGMRSRSPVDHPRVLISDTCAQVR